MVKLNQLANHKSQRRCKLGTTPIESLFSISFLFVALASMSCSKSTPTEPDINLDQEAALIPWQRITGKIAYCRSYTSGYSEGGLFVIDGSAKKLIIVKKSTEGYFRDLAWSSDGTELIYSNFDSPTSAFWQLYSINSDGSTQSRLYPSNAHNCCPAWSSDGRLAYWFSGGFINGESRELEIWIGSSCFYRKSECNESRPAWSHDNKSLVISIYDTTSACSFYKVSLADTTITRLLKGPLGAYEGYFGSPIYSPDGTKIAFMDQNDIWTMNADGTGQVRLTAGQYDDYPAWSPDGKQIAFMRSVSGSPLDERVYLMNEDGSQQTQITQNEGEYPAWTP